MAETPTYNDEININQPLIVNDKPNPGSNPFILQPESIIQDKEIHIPFNLPDGFSFFNYYAYWLYYI